MVHLIGFALIIYACFYGCYANPFWKFHTNHQRYANGLIRAIIGVPAWVAVVFLMLGNIGSFFLWLAITIVCTIPSILKMRADGILSFRVVHLVIMASMGVYARIVLAFTIIGLIVTRRTKRAAEIGWQGAAQEWMDDMKKNNASSAPSFSGANSYKPSYEPDYSAKPQVEAWQEQEDGSLKPLQVNSDGSMYKDPDTGEWVKISK